MQTYKTKSKFEVINHSVFNFRLNKNNEETNDVQLMIQGNHLTETEKKEILETVAVALNKKYL